MVERYGYFGFSLTLPDRFTYSYRKDNLIFAHQTIIRLIMRVFLSRALLFLAFIGTTTQALPQSEGVDTTSSDYQIGYEIGSWLPFIILFTLALMVIIRSFRLSQKKGPQ
jgi:hypothetical protein